MVKVWCRYFGGDEETTWCEKKGYFWDCGGCKADGESEENDEKHEHGTPMQDMP